MEIQRVVYSAKDGIALNAGAYPAGEGNNFQLVLRYLGCDVDINGNIGSARIARSVFPCRSSWPRGLSDWSGSAHSPGCQTSKS